MFKSIILCVGIIICFFVHLGCWEPTDIFDAASKGKLRAVKRIVKDDPATMYSQDENGNTPIMISIMRGHNEIAIFLLDEGFPPDGLLEKPTFPACFAGPKPYSDEMLRILLERGADPNYIYLERGWIPLHMAVNNYEIEKIKILVRHGADLSMRDLYGQTVIEKAKEDLEKIKDPNFHPPWIKNEAIDRPKSIKKAQVMVDLLEELEEGQRKKR